jgi:cob(I)alamin adenosyltransferase
MVQKGLVIVFTGNGKGKTSAALGVALRSCGHHMHVSLVHFIKTSSVSGEERAAERLRPELEIVSFGRGFVKQMGDNLPFAEHQRAAADALAAARQRISSNFWDVVILDEINNAVSLGLLDVRELLDLLTRRPPRLHVILTGRDAHPDIIALADMVTEMNDIKHPFESGLPAQQGIDY